MRPGQFVNPDVENTRYTYIDDCRIGLAQSVEFRTRNLKFMG